MARKSKKQKLEEQRVRQAAVRETARKSRRPDRDDLARTLLWLMIREAHAEARRRQSSAPLDKLCAVLVTNLEAQGFDADESEDVYNALEKKYRTQVLPGRIKRHLGRSANGFGASTL
jgi:hypothetical protein